MRLNTGVTLDKATRELLDELARREDRSRSSVIRVAVRERAERLGVAAPPVRAETQAAPS